MSDVMMRPLVEVSTGVDGQVQVERRCLGRVESASAELIQLLRNPASREARVRVALYDAPGFLLPTGPSARRPRVNALKVTAAIVALGAVWGVVLKAMCMAWG
jgi:hypothetical protein